ncbi:hypothetical protein JW960_10430 [candidate division KSB1 bacterium]|nr:hypothetical protein [candidate division KSB1 bacterium]
MKKLLLFLLIPTAAFSQHKLTLYFEGFTPHVGQPLFIRVIEKARAVEVGRQYYPVITDPAFDIDLYVLIAGNSYQIDYYADLNLNGEYDAPPTDRAWRTEVGPVSGDTEMTLTHNTNFTDIQFPAPLSMVDLVDDYSGKWINPTFSVEDNVRW